MIRGGVEFFLFFYLIQGQSFMLFFAEPHPDFRACRIYHHELHVSMEQPGRWRAQSGRLAAKVSFSGCSS